MKRLFHHFSWISAVLVGALTGCLGGANGSLLSLPGFQSSPKKATPTPIVSYPTPVPTASAGKTPTPSPTAANGSVTVDVGAQHNAWGVSEPMSTLRAGSIAWVRNGKIYVADGDGYGTIEEYSGGTWSAKQFARECHYFSSAALIGSQLYQASGFTGDDYYPAILEYDTLTGTVSEGPSLPDTGVVDPASPGEAKGRSYSGSGVLRLGGVDFFCLAGGAIGSSVLDQTIGYLTSTRTWCVFDKMPAPRAAMGAAVLDNRLYLFGGYDSNGRVLGSMLLFDGATRRWSDKAPNGSALPSLSKPRHSLMALAFNGKIYAIGGVDENNQVLRDVEEYDPSLNTWRSFASMPTARALGATVVLDNRIYVLGGFDGGGHPLRTVEVFYP